MLRTNGSCHVVGRKRVPLLFVAALGEQARMALGGFLVGHRYRGSGRLAAVVVLDVQHAAGGGGGENGEVGHHNIALDAQGFVAALRCKMGAGDAAQRTGVGEGIANLTEPAVLVLEQKTDAAERTAEVEHHTPHARGGAQRRGLPPPYGSRGVRGGCRRCRRPRLGIPY